jgi:tetratricopeptide (TPR) repeat protein
MFGKVANALIRREADAYRAQGLQEEALRVLQKALAATPNLHPDVRTGIEQQIHQIEAEMSGKAFEEHQQLSEEQIAVIREGWCENCTLDDVVVCGQALHALGRHGDALVEFRNSIQKGYSAHRVLAPVADCFVHLHAPHELPGRVTNFAKEMFREPKDGFNFMLSLAEQMLATGDHEHATALGRRLAEFKGVPPNFRRRLDALLKTLRASEKDKKSRRSKDHPETTDPTPSRSILLRIRDAFKFFTSRDG